MKNLFFTITFLLSLVFLSASFAKERAPASLDAKSYFKIHYGSHTYDEIQLEKQNSKVWEATFVDQGRVHPQRILKRAFPAEVAKERLFEFESLFKKLHQHLVSDPMPGSCTFRMSVEWGKSASSVTKKEYCTDGLTDLESHQLGEWISETTRLFKF